ncbi:MAG: hypothetical protein GF308_00220 [Candidatus Heimdallarchaeota archaeon]|nr:hypothetical protein [Candidatus Heimdallarchaeota archaeon]
MTISSETRNWEKNVKRKLNEIKKDRKKIVKQIEKERRKFDGIKDQLVKSKDAIKTSLQDLLELTNLFLMAKFNQKGSLNEPLCSEMTFGLPFAIFAFHQQLSDTIYFKMEKQLDELNEAKITRNKKPKELMSSPYYFLRKSRSSPEEVNQLPGYKKRSGDKKEILFFKKYFNLFNEKFLPNYIDLWMKNRGLISNSFFFMNLKVAHFNEDKPTIILSNKYSKIDPKLKKSLTNEFSIIEDFSDLQSDPISDIIKQIIYKEDGNERTSSLVQYLLDITVNEVFIEKELLKSFIITLTNQISSFKMTG